MRADQKSMAGFVGATNNDLRRKAMSDVVVWRRPKI
jgi:hypothetical protein